MNSFSFMKLLISIVVSCFLISSCRDIIVSYSGKVIDDEGDPVEDVRVLIVRNDVIVSGSLDSLTQMQKHIIKEKGSLKIYPIKKTDTIGRFNLVIHERYFFSLPELKLLFKKEGYQHVTIDLEWKNIKIDSVIILTKKHGY